MFRSERRMPMTADAAALAALSLTESLVRALAESQMMPIKDLRGALEDAEISHRKAAAQGLNPDANQAAASAIRNISATVTARRPAKT